MLLVSPPPTAAGSNGLNPHDGPIPETHHFTHGCDWGGPVCVLER